MRFRREQEAAENATWGMLIGFAAALVLIVVAVNAGLAIALRLMLPVVHGYPPLFFETNTAIVLLFVLGGCWIETLRLREGGARVARLAGARPADPAGRQRGARLERRLVDVVEEIAIAARTRPPSAWVLPRDLNINAFAAGWTADDAVIANG
jgi:Zn-dependent protease with chaperone function